MRAFDQQRRDTSTRPFYLNRASALGNFGLAGSLGEDLAANWLYMKMALVQVGIDLSLNRTQFFLRIFFLTQAARASLAH